MIRQVKHMGQADSTSIGPTSGADARQGAAGEFGSVESGRATDTDTTPREAAATPIRVAVVDDHEMFRAAFLALSVSDSPQDVGSVIRAGARGYVTKTITGDDLISSIKQVHEGYAVFSPKLAGFVLSAFQGAPMDGAGGARGRDEELDLLSSREQEVMRLIARGYTYKEVAAELFISIKTVETHMSNVLRKLQLSNRTELTRWAADRRIV